MDHTHTNIEIPIHFLCPISLHLMKDPVTISTGITYDRDSIEKWLHLSSKNNSCPVTKQPLHDNTDLIPNHTLRRLIQSWCTLNASNGVDRIPTPKSPLDKTQIAKLINNAKKTSQALYTCLNKLRELTTDNERNQSCLATTEVLEFLISVVNKKYSTSCQEYSGEALSILCHLKINQPSLKTIFNKINLEEFIESIVSAMKYGKLQTRAQSTMLIKSVLEASDPVKLISIKPDLFVEIVRVLNHQISQQATKSALKLLLEVCPWGRNRIKAVEANAVHVLIELLLLGKDKRTCELVLVVLDQLCSCAEGRAELLKHGAGVATVSKKVLRVSQVATDRGVRIISSVCRFSGTSKVLQEMLQVGVVAKLCLVLQVETSLKTMERAKEILKLHSRSWRNSPCIPPDFLSSYPSS